MNRNLSLVAAAASVLALSACAFDAGEPGDETGTAQHSLGEKSIDENSNGLDSLMAALGSATLDCIGTTGKDTYKIVQDKSGAYLTRTFDKCTQGKDPGAGLKAVDALLAIQFTKYGQNDGVAKHYVGTWKAFQDKFPGVQECPQWAKTKVINAPDWDTVKAAQGDVKKQGESYEYKVWSKSCGQDGSCAVKAALACAGGYGADFLISGNGKGSTVVVDPIWWLTHYQFGEDASNPFMTPGYYHAMSYYGSPPGALYGAIEREGEPCSKWSETNAKHYTDRKLVAIDCGGGWYCATYCM